MLFFLILLWGNTSLELGQFSSRIEPRTVACIHEGVHGLACIPGGIEKEIQECLYGLACIPGGIGVIKVWLA